MARRNSSLDAGGANKACRLDLFGDGFGGGPSRRLSQVLPEILRKFPPQKARRASAGLAPFSPNRTESAGQNALRNNSIETATNVRLDQANLEVDLGYRQEASEDALSVLKTVVREPLRASLRSTRVGEGGRRSASPNDRP